MVKYYSTTPASTADLSSQRSRHTTRRLQPDSQSSRLPSRRAPRAQTSRSPHFANLPGTSGSSSEKSKTYTTQTRLDHREQEREGFDDQAVKAHTCDLPYAATANSTCSFRISPDSNLPRHPNRDGVQAGSGREQPPTGAIATM